MDSREMDGEMEDGLGDGVRVGGGMVGEGAEDVVMRIKKELMMRLFCLLHHSVLRGRRNGGDGGRGDSARPGSSEAVVEGRIFLGGFSSSSGFWSEC